MPRARGVEIGFELTFLFHDFLHRKTHAPAQGAKVARTVLIDVRESAMLQRERSPDISGEPSKGE
jgi:hypothetical protein